MQLDLLPILSGETKELPFEFTLDTGSEEAAIYLKGSEAIPTGPISVSGRLYNLSGYMKITFSTSLPYRAACARCLKTVETVFHCDSEFIITPDDKDGEDGYIRYTDRMLDVDVPVYEEIVLNFPSRTLCREECRGLCPKCGKDLNEGDCDCNKSTEV